VETSEMMDVTPLTEIPASVSGEALRALQLRRLERLLRLRRQHEHDLNRQGLRLIDRAVFAAYCDCRDAGAGDDARHVLREAALAAHFAPRQLPLPAARPRPQPTTPGARLEG
jgi:hypothetical protein